MTAPITPSETDAAELKRFGIVMVTTPQYIVGRYRYNNRADAIAEAKRHLAGNGA